MKQVLLLILYYAAPSPEKPAPRLLSLIHISEPTRLGMISYAVFCLKKKKKKIVCRLLLDERYYK